uniref:AP2/ERF domain-containing protein n=1 Tax=Chloropicon primus TaxID=1764295 RepID=A0A7S2T791_9CHLO|mmetsp:Transcript_9934/g.28232  ORF Transcript_9934/g.28232 Transcript_9934/m.28232 type:complete len:217 (+) Transcript_9934:2-652(+)
MKVAPRTKNFVPNDIFVQAMGPDGVLPEVPQVKKHSKYRGVTRHRKSGRWESHIWIKETGKQMYLGAYENEVHAAEAYDVAALKIKGEEKARLNFDASKYSEYKELLETLTLAELVKTVKSKVPATVRLASSYKGVYYSTKEDMWEAKYQPQDKRETRSLGFFEHDIEAAKAFDREMVLQHGTVCGVNFKHTDYEKELLLFHERELQRLDSKTSEE